MTFDDERQAIRLELEAMRANGARRHELSLHACKRLFFDLGIRPSMATVRDLTQTGSASDIPKDIDRFWERIREASKVRIGAGAIPKALEEKAGELLGALFEEAQALARDSLDAERRETIAAIEGAQQRVREAEILRNASDEALQRSEARAEVAWTRVRELEAQTAVSASEHIASHESLQGATRRLEAENENLGKRLEVEQAANAALRDRIDALHTEMRQNAEHYAQQIKDAIAEAERRVKPMLVELDSLRTMAATYQAGIRDASRKEFDFIQQLSVAKTRSDRLDAQVRNQSDEIDALARELDTLRARQGVAPELAQLLCALAQAGRLNASELAAVGSSLDGHVTVPGQCPKCEGGEPELSQVGDGYELFCPECEHSSGVRLSRFEAVAQFLEAAGA